ncbi:Gfo/Idh/MocA family protein [Rhodohalobacter sulfatireducens]|uniref:Gfo/Idh/MocA family oxidoreductase n=1 Tax=Rhodohalobacter sulfatireducens TaxID=2911366 RepID=A0ABS9KBU5_9BACT|nr:Gfo/Idh/MocA family oxidoreductase [Rhodohalobacter sulfatireducens]MCG2588334.1 Gfo/Idh/MocA family oxidoreductase [Rhodohalobacter sulfatireducens]
MSNISRKNFLRNSALGLAGFAIAPKSGKAAERFEELKDRDWKKKFQANDQIQIATIGMGIIAHFDTPTALEVPGVKMVAAADCYDSRLVRTKEVFGDDVFTTKDYREILERDDVDAVLLCTPDHWHAKHSIDFLGAGKHVYCEKPMVQRIDEGLDVINADQNSNAVLQVGSQFTSDMIFQKAKELYESGAIGTLNQVVAVYNRNSSLGAWQYSMPEDATPDTVDWDTFLGDAPDRPWDPKRFFRWRCYDDYGTGVPGDLFVHLFTGIHTVLGAVGPTHVSGTGGLRSWFDGREAPDVINGQYHYPETDNHPDFTLTLQSNLADGGGTGTRFQFIGDEGAMEIAPGNSVKLTRIPRREPSMDDLQGYNSLLTFSEEVQEEFKQNYREQHADEVEYQPEMNQTEEFRTPDGYDSRLDHFVNFFDSIRNGTPVFEDSTFGFRAAAPALLTNTSLKEQRVVRWDPENMRVPS